MCTFDFTYLERTKLSPPLLVKAIFEHLSDVPIYLNQFEAELLYKIKQLESGNNTSLIDANVVPTNDAAKTLSCLSMHFLYHYEICCYRTIQKRDFFYLPKVIRISVLFFKIFY